MRINMPSKSPLISSTLTHDLAGIGAQIKAHRKGLKLSATVVAESAGLSRVTLHRIEKGEPSVTMGAYVSVIDALGMSLKLERSKATSGSGVQKRGTWMPTKIYLNDHLELKKISWHVTGVEYISPGEARDIYERNWHHVDQGALIPEEKGLIEALGINSYSVQIQD
jgi:transcriptional regulator with XRE-family HTH domain